MGALDCAVSRELSELDVYRSRREEGFFMIVYAVMVVLVIDLFLVVLGDEQSNRDGGLPESRES